MSNTLGQFQEVISKRIAGVQFSYYTAEEIRKLSVKEITSPIAFDSLNRPIKGGLYDPLMGVSPYDKLTRCETCGCEGLDCPGHMAHIELLLPVYNPFLVDKLLKLLRTLCLNCFKFRMTKQKLRMYTKVFTLIKLGYVQDAKEYKSIQESLFSLQASSTNQKQQQEPQNNRRKSSECKTSDTELINNQKIISSQEQKANKMLQNNLKILEEKKAQILSLINVKNEPEFFKNGINSTTAMNNAFDEILKEFWAHINIGKCPHCKQQQSAVRKEGFSKFFVAKKGKNNHEEHDEPEQEKKQDISEKTKNQKYLDPIQIKQIMQLFWSKEKKILDLIFGRIDVTQKSLKNTKKGFKIFKNDYNMFFIEVIPVPPNRFRPENKLGEQTFLHGHTVVLTKIIQFNVELRQLIVLQNQNLTEDKKKKLLDQLDSKFKNYLQLKQNTQFQQSLTNFVKINDIISKWLDIQDSVNIFFDSAKSSKAQDREGTGIRQLLEKKEGLFRMKMMGKRVNYAARSVISPDPNLNTNEVGVPLFVAKKLTFPEHVNEYNVKFLRKLIINGPFQHPGANFIIENGNKISLEALNEQQRIGLAKTLLNNSKNKVVYRHLQSGDVLLFNRQPTLHKPSLMSHIARVLPREQTIRMHYANCKSYNADFDGDEMNLHFLQSHLARAEGYHISLNDRQFINATNGVPLRELIQDSIVSAVYLTHKEKFFNKEEFQLLLYSATWNMFQNNNIQGKPYKIFMLPPSILKPQKLWTGKQLISNIIKIVVQQNQTKDYEQGIYMEFKSKLSQEELSGIYKDDTQVLIKDNELLQGVLDKNSFGAGATYGLMHSFYELYGANLTGKLFTALAKLLSTHLQMHGFTCGVDDILVEKNIEQIRLQEIKKAHKQGLLACAREFLDDKEFEIGEKWDLYGRSEIFQDKKRKKKPENDYLSTENQILGKIQQKLIRDPLSVENQDNIYKSTLSQNASTILNITLNGLIKKFPYNNFSTMTNSGAKGSKVNHTQVSALLGQQELEGKRVPTMSTGKTLPCFVPYDPNPRAGGFISDRFLSGLRPAEFFFHCMAGREGLIDTAVKTSRSGYLQRCLMKHLESLKVAYDYTVRDSDNSIVQFYYGEDCIDTNKVKYLEKYRFLSENFKSFSQKYEPYNLKESHDFTSVQKFLSKRKKTPEKHQNQTIMSNFLPGKYIGSISEKVYKSVREYIKKEENQNGYSNIFSQKPEITPAKFRLLYNIKYLNSLIQPGDSVGCLAAQAIGEPSTQMTLNTFHLAGHGGVNLTLGIPRLREILMTATDKLKTPAMLLNFQDEKNIQYENAQSFARKLQKINLLELVNNIEVQEQKIVTVDNKILPAYERFRHYEIKIQLEDLNAIAFAFQITLEQISRRFLKLFLPNFLQYINKELKRDQKQELETRILRQNYSQSASCGIDTDALMTENEKTDYISDGEKLNKYEETETEFYNAFTENEEDTKVQQYVNSPNNKKCLIQKLNNSYQQQQVNKQQQNRSDLFKASPYYNGHDIQGQLLTFKIKLPLDSKKLLMANLVEKILKKTLVYEIKNIQNAALLKKETKDQITYQVQVQGVNFKSIWKMEHFNADTIDSNDIAAINLSYGIEAARNAIVKEIVTVFGVYGVVVDYRHLYLIADYLTFGGKLKAMNRTWMEENISPFLKMSFETCIKFLTNAATNNEVDNLSTPSSSIVVGRVPQVGTGVFDILYQF